MFEVATFYHHFDVVKEGDTVKPGDVIAEIETDKATMEVEPLMRALSRN